MCRQDLFYQRLLFKRKLMNLWTGSAIMTNLGCGARWNLRRLSFCENTCKRCCILLVGRILYNFSLWRLFFIHWSTILICLWIIIIIAAIGIEPNAGVLTFPRGTQMWVIIRCDQMQVTRWNCVQIDFLFNLALQGNQIGFLLASTFRSHFR